MTERAAHVGEAWTAGAWAGRALRAAALLLALIVPAQADEPWPVRPIRLIVGFAPGGSVDLVARWIAEPLGQALGQPVLVDNRPGAGSMIAAALVAQAPADGYTLLQNSSSHVVAPLLQKQASYDPVRDFTPIAKVGYAPNILLVANASPARDLAGVIALARGAPGKLTYGTPGHGSITHLSGELLKHMAGIDIVPVAYRGGALSVQSLVGGEIPMAFNTLPEVVGQVQSGTVRAIAVTTKQRSSLFPQIPTFAEAGLANYEVEVWQAWLGPAGLPPAIAARLQAVVARASTMPGVRQRMAELGAEAASSTGPELDATMRAERAKWRPLIEAGGIRTE